VWINPNKAKITYSSCQKWRNEKEMKNKSKN
jgi:hypothetical protein